MERLTEEQQIGVFATLKNHKSTVGEFGTYEAFYQKENAPSSAKQGGDKD